MTKALHYKYTEADTGMICQILREIIPLRRYAHSIEIPAGSG